MALSFSEAAAQAVQGTACSLLALSDEATQWINSAYGADADFGNIAGALRKRVCNESNPDTSGVGPEVPFTGGQCPVRYFVEYEADYSLTNCATGDVQTFDNPYLPLFPCSGTNRMYGPVSATRLEVAGDCGPRQIGWRVSGFSFDLVTPVSTDLLIGSAASGRRVEGTVNLRVTRCDGQPDSCGDPGGEVGDYNDYSETVSITYEDNSETEITEDIDITIGPLIVGIGGVVYAPVTVTTGPIDIDGRLVLAPEIKVDLFPDGGGGGGTSDPIPDPGEPDPQPDPEERRDRIIGVVVTTTAYDEDLFQGTYVAQGDSPDLFLPRLGNVSFFVETSGGQAWTDPLPVKTVRCYVPCPAREGAVDVAVTTETGITVDVAPVYAELSTAL